MEEAFVNEEAREWFATRTIKRPPLEPGELAALKREHGTTVAVALPALNEAATIGPICGRIRHDLMETAGLVDELIVVDSGSHDGTAAIAASEGATVLSTVDHLMAGGKGAALQHSLAAAASELIVWIDADIQNFDPRFVTSLVAPLIADASLVFTKGFYERPLGSGSDTVRPVGGRVTELVARPLINLLYPRLSGLIQPLAGEYAARRAALLEVPFVTGYGVDIALLIDVTERYGLEAIAQVDLGVRVHRNRDLLALGVAAHQVIQGLLLRLEGLGRLKLAGELSEALVQFAPAPEDVGTRVRELAPLNGSR